MPIRINKVTKECSVGLQTLVNFLNKKGFADVEANPNATITDEQYALVLAEFKKDAARSPLTPPVAARKPKERKETIVLTESGQALPLTEVKKPKFVGHLEVDAKGKIVLPKAEPKPTPQPEPKPAPSVEAPAPQPAPEPEVKTTPVPESAPQPESKPATTHESEVKPASEPEAKSAPAPESVSAAEPAQESQSQPAAAAVEQPNAPATTDASEVAATIVEPTEAAATKQSDSSRQERKKKKTAVELEEIDGVFRVKTSTEPLLNLQIKGHIDLDSINQSTRPPRGKKRKKGAAGSAGAAEVRGKKKGERVDIKAEAAKQQNQGGGQQKKNKGGA